MTHVSEELRLVLTRFRELTALVLDFVEQPHVLDGDDRLIGKRVYQSDLLISEGLHNASRKNKDTDRNSFAQQWHTKQRAHVCKARLRMWKEKEFGVGLGVLDLNSLTFADDTTGDGLPAGCGRDWTRNHVFALPRRKTIAGDVMEQTIPRQPDCHSIGTAETGR